MKLYYSATSPYARKVRLTLLELGLDKSVQLIPTVPSTDESLRGINPLCKIPALQLDDGNAMYDSPVICEYLNSLVKGKIFPRSGPARWSALRRQALADGLADAIVRIYLEQKRPEAEQHKDVIARQILAIDAALDQFEREPLSNRRNPPLIGELALASSLGYLDLRMPQHNWRKGRSRLKKWYNNFSARPSMQATQPPA
jgi:glutathione S-transferase